MAMSNMTANLVQAPDFAPCNFVISDFASVDKASSWQRYRGLTIVVLLHIALLWFMFSGYASRALNIIKPVEQMVVQEVVIPPAPPPPVPTPVPAKTETPETPQPPIPQPKAEVAQRTDAPSDTPAPATLPTPNVTPTPVTVVVQPQMVAPVVTSVPEKRAPAPGTLEAEYTGKIRAMLNTTKRYPTGRQASQERPQGTTVVTFVLNRNGILIGAAVKQSSESNLLDDAAVAGVRRATYPPFEAELWKGQETHEFSVDIDFAPPGGR
jgi:protein TonB